MIDGRTTQHAGYAVSQPPRGELVGSVRLSTVTCHDQVGAPRASLPFQLAAVADNLIRLPKMLAGAT